MRPVFSLATSQKPHVILLVFSLILVLPVHSLKLLQARSSPDGAPRRPQHFHSIEELNKYLAELTDYYTVLGRPRFGKRSDSSPVGQLPFEDIGFKALPKSTRPNDLDSRYSLTLKELLRDNDYKE
ncbi:hypothetical protein LSH36_37g13073, partial [Paralvinella palmiformis]